MAVIQASAQAVVERNARDGQVDTVIGCVDTGAAEVNVVVSGNLIDVSITSKLAEEGPVLAALTALEEAQAHAYIGFDDVDAEGLIRLIRQAIEVRAQGLAASVDGGGPR
jgi:hypothetical protein